MDHFGLVRPEYLGTPLKVVQFDRSYWAPFPPSLPVARDHWGIFELIIRESWDKGVMGRPGLGNREKIKSV